MSTDATQTSLAAEIQRPTEQMWRQMLPQLRTFVRRRVADPNRADDLVSEILLRVHQNVGSLDDRDRLPNWVFRIARNAIIDEYRRAGRSRRLLVSSYVALAPPAGHDDPPLRPLSAVRAPVRLGSNTANSNMESYQ